MNSNLNEPVRVGILWRGDRSDDSPMPPDDRKLARLFEAFHELNVVAVPVAFADDEIGDVREEILGCDGVLVWVNPIQDGANRSALDVLLREASVQGVFISAHPDTILKLGTKEVIFRTRELGWGSDTALYGSLADFKERFPVRLAARGRLVVKQARGNGGNGVWKVELVDSDRTVSPNEIVRVQSAQSSDGSSALISLGSFMDSCEEYFSWSGCLVDQEYLDRLSEGMLRCYFTHDEVVGFARQWPRGLLDQDPNEAPVPARSSVMEGPDDPAYKALRTKAELEWVPQMMSLLGLDRESLPVVWDADFLYGPKDATGNDTYVLCEINVSAVWPFPPMASEKIARAALQQVSAAKAQRAGKYQPLT
ncbi:MAG TPA: Cj0069 family protein [Acidimicrobiales bacterium]|nr:Cj0069 family protein [Acidimicrobiales bacterium]